MKTALVIVDVQNDFVNVDGRLSVPGGHEIVTVINDMREKAKFDLVVLTQDYHPAGHMSFQSTYKDDPKAVLFNEYILTDGRRQVLWPDHCVQGSSGAEFHPKLVVRKTDEIVQKGTSMDADSYSGFMDNDKIRETRLKSVLKAADIERVVVVGLALDYCVGFTALDAKTAGFKVVVCEDATRAVSKMTGDAMLAQLKDAGVQLTTWKKLL